MTDLRQWAKPPSDKEALAYEPQEDIRVLEDDPMSAKALEAFNFFLRYADELELAVASNVPWPKGLTLQAQAALEGLDGIWVDGVADALTGETLTIDAGMTAVSNWFRRHILR